LPVPIIYGAISDLSITGGIDSGDGQCPSIYVGMYVLSDARTYHKWVLCGHAVKSIDGLYTDNGDSGVGTNPASQIGDLSVQAGIGGDWVVPGYALWTSLLGADTFEDINGNRYTTFYGLVGNKLADVAAGFYKPDGAKNTPPLALNVQGIEDQGDGSGALITNLHAQYLHLLQNWILGNYTSGAWLTSPAFQDDPLLAQIDELSFASASDTAAIRVPGGYRGDFIIGWSTFDGNSQSQPKFWTVRDLVAAMNMSADVDSGFNRKMQFMVSMEHETISDITEGTIVDDIQDIFDQTFSIEDRLAEQFNDYRWFHTEDYFKRSIIGWRFQDQTKDDDSIAGYQEDKLAPDLMFYMIRGFNRASDYAPYEQGTLTAQDVIFRRLRRTKNPPRYATFTMGFAGNNFELGDIILVTHFDGIGPSGWSARPVRITALNNNPNDLSVQIVGYDMGDLFNTAFILGDRTVLTTWTTETPALKIYGFLGDRTTREFSNGDPIKRLG
jgi:hypothetical protein